ncbi:hypothetical protein ACIO3S_17985 [Nocardioides sp. NPDC087217]|uniref:hypothetical protein n=1 Tax=Nocardioides sp. NPDC087217 TaxID=3364335 RepID=UPI00380FE7F0
MEPDDLFTDQDEVDPFGSPATLRSDLIKALRSGPIPDDNDLATAVALTRLVHGELTAFGTDGNNRLDDEEIELCQRALRATLGRHGVMLNLPWRDFNGFRSFWIQKGARGSWQARRDLLAGYFEPVWAQLDHLEEAQFRAVLAEPVSPHHRTGWLHVDEEIRELQRRFRSAATAQDYRDVGNRAVAVLEALSRTIYDPAKHLRDGEVEPPVDRTNLRIGRYIEDSLGGGENEEVRGVAKKVSELAHKVKHRPAPTRRDAGIAADSVILFANILRRLDQEF